VTLELGGHVPETLLRTALGCARASDDRAEHHEALDPCRMVRHEQTPRCASPGVSDNGHARSASFSADELDCTRDLQDGIAGGPERGARDVEAGHLWISIGLAITQKVQCPDVVAARRQRLHPGDAPEGKIGGKRGRKRSPVHEQHRRRPVADVPAVERRSAEAPGAATA